jgi:hypothetical protein
MIPRDSSNAISMKLSFLVPINTFNPRGNYKHLYVLRSLNAFPNPTIQIKR